MAIFSPALKMIRLRQELAQRGLDIVGHVRPREGFGAGQDVVVVGNTRELWGHIGNGNTTADPDPVDNYVRQSLEEVLAVLSLVETSLPMPHIHYSGTRPYPPLQSLAQSSGIAHYCRPIGYCVSPLYGPWISLRAALVFPPTPSIESVAKLWPRFDVSLPPFDLDAVLRVMEQTGGDMLAVRKAIPIGRDDYIFSEEQILYHHFRTVPKTWQRY